MTKLILTDVDETVVQFADSFQAWCEARGYIANGRMRDIYHVDELFGVDEDEAVRLITEFTHDHHELRNMPPEEDALEILPMLYEKGFRMVAITACAEGPSVVENRTHNLEATFGFKWDAVHVTGLRTSKKNVLEQYPSAIWVEDNFGHAVVGAEMGHQTFLLTRTYNRGLEHPLVTRVDSWHEIYDIIG